MGFIWHGSQHNVSNDTESQGLLRVHMLYLQWMHGRPRVWSCKGDSRRTQTVYTTNANYCD
jgi:hypothetical protein